MSFLEQILFGNPVRDWLMAAVIALALVLGLRLLRAFLVRRIKKLASRTSNQLDDVASATLASTRYWFLLFLGIWAGARTLELPPPIPGAIGLAIAIATVLQAIIWSNVAVRTFTKARVQHALQEDPAEATAIAAIGVLVRLALWIVIALVALSNLGIEIGPLLAGLGVGGVAVALAVQSILGDLFASLSIVLDKPFVIGDFIVVDDLAGSIENVGLKTTRLRSLTGEQVVLSNSDLLRARIRNYKRMHERRIVFTIGVTYSTPREKLARIPGMIRAIIEAQPDARFDRSHFLRFGDFSLDFETVYWVRLPDYNVYMDTQQNINLALHERFEEEGIEFAFPTQTVIVEPAERTAVPE